MEFDYSLWSATTLSGSTSNLVLHIKPAPCWVPYSLENPYSSGIRIMVNQRNTMIRIWISLKDLVHFFQETSTGSRIKDLQAVGNGKVKGVLKFGFLPVHFEVVFHSFNDSILKLRIKVGLLEKVFIPFINYHQKAVKLQYPYLFIQTGNILRGLQVKEIDQKGERFHIRASFEWRKSQSLPFYLEILVTLFLTYLLLFINQIMLNRGLFFT